MKFWEVVFTICLKLFQFERNKEVFWIFWHKNTEIYLFGIYTCYYLHTYLYVCYKSDYYQVFELKNGLTAGYMLPFVWQQKVSSFVSGKFFFKFKYPNIYNIHTCGKVYEMVRKIFGRKSFYCSPTEQSYKNCYLNTQSLTNNNNKILLLSINCSLKCIWGGRINKIIAVGEVSHLRLVCIFVQAASSKLQAY